MTVIATNLPAVGEAAPDFTLESTADEDVTLASFRGESNVVLAFFPLAFTTVCTAQMCSFTDDFSLFGSVNAKVFGISVDSLPTSAGLTERSSRTLIFLDEPMLSLTGKASCGGPLSRPSWVTVATTLNCWIN